MATKNLNIQVSVDGAQRAKSELTGITGSMKGLIGTMVLAAVAVKTLKAGFDLFTKSAAAAENQGIALKNVANVLRSTGKAAEISMGQITGMATAMQRMSNFGDEDIMMNATTSLLRFSSITAENIPRAQQLVVDMAAATGDLAGQAKMLGIALDDPILGLTRLRRAGVSFTEEQQNMIKSLVETGKTVEAQGLLMDALETKYSGNAASMISATKQLQNTWGDYLEFLGTRTQPVLDGIRNGFNIFFMNLLDNQATNMEGMSQASFNTMKNIANDIAKFMRTAQQGVTIFGGIVDTIVTYTVGAIRTTVDTGSKSIAKILPEIIPGIDAAVASFLGWDIGPLRDWIDSLTDEDDWNDVFQTGSDFADQMALNARNWAATMSNFESDINKIDRLTNNLRPQITSVVAGLDDSTGATSNLETKVQALGNTAQDALRKLMALQEQQKSQLEQYYSEVGKKDANYWDYRMQRINEDIAAMGFLSESQKALLFDMRKAALLREVSPKDGIIKKSKEQVETAISGTAQTIQMLQDTLTSGFGNTLTALLTGTESFATSMKNIWSDLANSIIASIAQMLAKMAVMAIFQSVLGASTGGIGSVATGIGASSGIGSLFAGGTKSYQPAYVPSVSGDSGSDRLYRAMGRLESAVIDNKPIVYTQVIEGVPFDNAVKRAARMANAL